MKKSEGDLLKKPEGELLEKLEEIGAYMSEMQKEMRPEDQRHEKFEEIQRKIKEYARGLKSPPTLSVVRELHGIIQKYHADGDFGPNDNTELSQKDLEVVDKFLVGSLKSETKREPVAAQESRITSAQRFPVQPPRGDSISDEELFQLARRVIGGKGRSSPEPVEEDLSKLDLSDPSKISNRQLGALAKSIFSQSQGRQNVTESKTSDQDIKDALEEVSHAYQHSHNPFLSRDFKDSLQLTIMTTKREGSSADVINRFLQDVSGKKVLSSKQDDLIKKFMATEGVKRAMEDPKVQEAFRTAAESLSPKSGKLITDKLPAAVEKQAVVKK